MKKRWWILAGVIVMSVSLFGSCTNQAKKFRNSDVDYKVSGGGMIDMIAAYIKADRAAPAPVKPMPLRQIPTTELRAPEAESAVYRLGHSTVLIRMDDQYILTDPVFSKRASPVQWMGPKRFHPLPIEIRDLPSIKVVVISHDHYDHLDKNSIRALRDKVEQFVVPSGVGQHLRDWGIPAEKIEELTWWESFALGSLRFTATPAQHFSGRGLTDKDSTLWASWVMEGREGRIFFSGDSGYFSGFREIGERFGPFDLTLMETGAYNQLWSSIHMTPEQSVQAHLDLGGRAMLPIHNSTFDLALHDWYEPLERAQVAAKDQGVTLVTPIIGEAVRLHSPATTKAWWKDEMAMVTDLRLVSE
ncbi:MBL fold metallo-hydrolase [Microbulbifer sp. ZKSA006]|uniref:MBL fold metallo-hydrolase n=1 Tax=Microbulbifer sp. ZKSA006 TaxID=3243390 RepID=UPI00403A6226